MTRRRIATVAAAGVVAAGAIAVGVAATPAAAPAPACESYPDARTPELARELCGPILQHYLAAGGPGSIHGLPTSDETPTSASSRRYGDREVRFANGTIVVDTRSGETSSAYWERGT